MRLRAQWLALVVSLAACPAAKGPSDSGFDVRADAGAALNAALVAANTVALTDVRCTQLGDFAWEIGDVDGRLGGGTVGSHYTAQSVMEIASATKWLFGAYVVEKFAGQLSNIDHEAMTMRSGYVDFNYSTCALLKSKTVLACFTALKNDQYTDAEVHHFHYNGGHFQKYAVDLGLGDLTSETLATEFRFKLGADIPFAFDSPQLGAGATMSIDGYAAFLRKVLRGELRIRDALGADAVCTLPGECSGAVSSPAPVNAHYSYGHWVEDQPDGGDGAFSSAGAYGFYPWVDSTKTYYGIVARRVVSSSAYVESVYCGQAIRAAFLNAR